MLENYVSQYNRKVQSVKSTLMYFYLLMISMFTCAGDHPKERYIILVSDGESFKEVDGGPVFAKAISGDDRAIEQLDKWLFGDDLPARRSLLLMIPKELGWYIESRYMKVLDIAIGAKDDTAWLLLHVSIRLDLSISIEIAKTLTKLPGSGKWHTRVSSARFLCMKGMKDYCKVEGELYLSRCPKMKQDGLLGIILGPIECPQPEGFFFQFICPNGPAERNGLMVGDVPATLNGKPVEGHADFITRIYPAIEKLPNEPIHIVVLRGKKKHKIMIKEMAWGK